MTMTRRTALKALAGVAVAPAVLEKLPEAAPVAQGETPAWLDMRKYARADVNYFASARDGLNSARFEFRQISVRDYVEGNF